MTSELDRLREENEHLRGTVLEQSNRIRELELQLAAAQRAAQISTQIGDAMGGEVSLVAGLQIKF
jgi:predicted RNase H-like nuclease (RuvC/YqgF family)